MGETAMQPLPAQIANLSIYGLHFIAAPCTVNMTSLLQGPVLVIQHRTVLQAVHQVSLDIKRTYEVLFGKLCFCHFSLSGFVGGAQRSSEPTSPLPSAAMTPVWMTGM